MPAAVRQEAHAQPESAVKPGPLSRYCRQLVGLSYSTPSIASADWSPWLCWVLVMIPFIVVMGLKHARPLALQFSCLRDAAKDVADGQFWPTGRTGERCARRNDQFAADFNTMTGQLARYEKGASRLARCHGT